MQTHPNPTSHPGERILFEARQLLLPTILNFEILTMLSFILVILIATVAFRISALELVLISVLYLILAAPSLLAIFRAGSTTYVLTNHQLLIFSAGLGKQNRVIPLDQIKEARCKASAMQRVYGAGDVLVYLKGIRRPQRLIGIKECSRRAEQINEQAKLAQ